MKKIHLLFLLALFVAFLSFNNLSAKEFSAPTTSPALASVGSYVWLDEDGDGDQDPGEPGIPNVRLILKNGSFQLIDTVYTDFYGNYKFNDLPTGVYYIVVDETTLPTGLSQQDYHNSLGDFGNQSYAGNGYKLSLNAGTKNQTADFGFNWGDANDAGNIGTVGALGNSIWSDANGNGRQDLGEPGIGGVSISLYIDSNGDEVIDETDQLYTAATDHNGATGGTTISRKDGFYAFYNLPPNNYGILVDDGASSSINGFTNTGDPDKYGYASTGDSKSKVITLALGQQYASVDFGYKPTISGNISGQLWMDATGDASFDPKELPFQEVSVTLIEDLNGNGRYELTEPSIASTLSDVNGTFSFDGLSVDDGSGKADYLICVNDVTDVLENVQPVTDPDGIATPHIAAVQLSAGSLTALNQDFPYLLNGHTVGNAFLGSTVFIDSNKDTLYTFGEGMEHVLVALFDNSGNKVASTYTNRNGQYFFGNLANGIHTIKISPSNMPPEMHAYVDPDGNQELGAANYYFAQGELVSGLDFGYEPLDSDGLVGDQIWNDTDGDGSFNGNEHGNNFANVTFDIYFDKNQDGLVNPNEYRVGSMTSSATGAYFYDNLSATAANGSDGLNYLIQVSDRYNRLTGYSTTAGIKNTDGTSQRMPFSFFLGPVDHIVNFADFGFLLNSYIDPTLPVELMNFHGEEMGCSVVLTWSTAMEHNSDYFLLEQSKDGKDFKHVALVPAAGFSSTVLNYSYTDDDYNSFNYYRLKQVDINGSTNMTSLVAPIKSTCPANTPLSISKVFPNPASAFVQIQINKPLEGVTTWNITDNLGRPLKSSTISASSGATRLNVDISDLPAGMYFLELTNSSYRDTKQFIKME